MRWYAIGNGPLRALKVLLESPLDFDPETYIARTFGARQPNQGTELVELAQIYNRQRRSLFPRVSGVAQALSHTAKFSADDYLSGASPIQLNISRSATRECFTDSALHSKICDSVNLQIDRMLESFHVGACNGSRFDAENLSDFIAFYFFSEVLFLALTGVGSVSTSESVFTVAPADRAAVAELHRKWFANYWESTSSAASIAYVDYLPKGADRGPAFSEVIKLLGQMFRDKIFSIPAKDMPLKLGQLESMSWMTRLSELVALCMWCQLKNDMRYAPFSLLDRFEISRDHVSILKELISRYPQPDRIFAFSSHGVRITNPTLTTQVRAVLNDLVNELSEKQLNSYLGDFFENEYLSEYFSGEDMKSRYRAHAGFLAHEVNNDTLKPDVDLIIEDMQRSWYYFVQVKYHKIGGKAYLLGDLEHILSDKLRKGIRQITDAKLAMESGALKDVLVSRGLTDASLTNSTFMLVHNIPNFDFCVLPQGVVSYEWNTLRNLFRDGEVRYGHTRQENAVWRNEAPMPLEYPDAVIDLLLKNSPASSVGGAKSLFESDNMESSVAIGEKVVRARGLGL